MKKVQLIPAILTLYLFTGCLLSAAGQPVITGISPAAAPAGTSIIISGSGFDTASSRNIVFFGTLRASVLTATASALVVRVPQSVGYAPVSVTVNRRTGWSRQFFCGTFNGEDILHSASFIEMKTINTGSAPKTLSAPDVDNDGRRDLVFTNQDVFRFSVLRNQGGGDYFMFTRQEVLSGAQPTCIFPFDANGDGWLDMGVSNMVSQSGSVFRNSSQPGTPFFDYRYNMPCGNFPLWVTAADLDTDGKPEMILVNNKSGAYPGTITMVRNACPDDLLVFTPRTDDTVDNAPCFAIAHDLDGDGLRDILVGYNINTPYITLLKNESTAGNIRFAAPVNLNAGGSTERIAIADIDGDGKPDIVAAQYGGSHAISIFRNLSTPGNITLAPRIDFITDYPPYDLAVEDLNGDGRPDITAIVPSGTFGIYVFINNSMPGTVALQLPAKFGFGGLGNLAVADLDGDNRPEIAALHGGSQQIYVYKNFVGDDRLTTLCPGSTVALASNITGTTYQWQRDTGTGFVNLANGGNFNGVQTAGLQIGNAPSSFYGHRFRCVVGGAFSSVFRLRFLSTWEGPPGSNWHNAALWNCGIIPDIYTDVVINGAVTVSANSVCRSLYTKGNATVTVQTGMRLQVGGQ